MNGWAFLRVSSRGEASILSLKESNLPNSKSTEEGLESRQYQLWPMVLLRVVARFPKIKIVACSLYLHQPGAGWDELHSFFYFSYRAERVARAVHKECRRMQLGEVLGAHLSRLAGRVKRVGEKKQTSREIGFGGAQHARLPSAVGMTSQEDPTRR